MAGAREQMIYPDLSEEITIEHDWLTDIFYSDEYQVLRISDDPIIQLTHTTGGSSIWLQWGVPEEDDV